MQGIRHSLRRCQGSHLRALDLVSKPAGQPAGLGALLDPASNILVHAAWAVAEEPLHLAPGCIRIPANHLLPRWS